VCGARPNVLPFREVLPRRKRVFSYGAQGYRWGIATDLAIISFDGQGRLRSYSAVKRAGSRGRGNYDQHPDPDDR
jgi:hypothetical protein